MYSKSIYIYIYDFYLILYNNLCQKSESLDI